MINQYVSLGKSLTLLQGKIPLLNNWGKRTLSVEELQKHKGNFGWVIGPNDLVVDVDPRNGGEKSFEKLAKDLLPNVLIPTVSTPSGGFHIYLEITEDWAGAKFRKNIASKYPGIDFLTQGSQCVIAGGSTEKGAYTWINAKKSFEQNIAPNILLEIISPSTSYLLDIIKDNKKDKSKDITANNNFNVSEKKVIDLLKKLDPSIGNDSWVKIGMALKNWDEQKGFQIWEEWSKNGANYDVGETDKRWKSFTNGGGITLGTVFHMVRELEFDKNEYKLTKYLELIKGSSEKQLELEILPSLKHENFNIADREKIVKSLKAKYKTVSDVKIPVSKIREMVAGAGVEKVENLIDEINPKVIPDWCKHWIWVTSHGGYFYTENLIYNNIISFDQKNDRFIPKENDKKIAHSAHKYASEYGWIPAADIICYLPTEKDIICYRDRQTILNFFDHNSLPIPDEIFTKEVLLAVEIIKKHFKFLCTTDERASLLTQWIAHNIQYPGKLIGWAPLIEGIPGTGKTFLADLLSMCLGYKNVGVVSPERVSSPYNAWANNKCVNVLEELKLNNVNRHIVVNKIKPLITNKKIDINEKNVKAYETYNSTNYICVTNSRDCIPMEDGERRWWVIFVDLESKREMAEKVGDEAPVYFQKLFAALNDHGGGILKWLKEYPISDEFKALKEAPMTDEKESMVATEEESTEGLVELQELIEEGGEYFCEDVISSADLFNALSFKYPNLSFSTSTRSWLLKKLRYMKLPKIMMSGKTWSIWAKKTMSAKEVRNFFKERTKVSSGDISPKHSK